MFETDRDAREESVVSEQGESAAHHRAPGLMARIVGAMIGVVLLIAGLATGLVLATATALAALLALSYAAVAGRTGKGDESAAEAA